MMFLAYLLSIVLFSLKILRVLLSEFQGLSRNSSKLIMVITPELETL